MLCGDVGEDGPHSASHPLTFTSSSLTFEWLNSPQVLSDLFSYALEPHSTLILLTISNLSTDSIANGYASGSTTGPRQSKCR